VFTFASIALLYLIQRFQGVLPLNPTGTPSGQSRPLSLSSGVGSSRRSRVGARRPGDPHTHRRHSIIVWSVTEPNETAVAIAPTLAA
jgi:hypothetical protein